jgi:hypothetical protein
MKALRRPSRFGFKVFRPSFEAFEPFSGKIEFFEHCERDLMFRGVHEPLGYLLVKSGTGRSVVGRQGHAGYNLTAVRGRPTPRSLSLLDRSA